MKDWAGRRELPEGGANPVSYHYVISQAADGGVTEFHEPSDMVNSPSHYRSHPSGIECIQVTEHMNFCLGNAIKYLWRADEKGSAIEDLEKACWYIQREIERRKQK